MVIALYSCYPRISTNNRAPYVVAIVYKEKPSIQYLISVKNCIFA